MAQFKLYLGLLLLLLAPITPSHCYLTRENVTFTQKTRQSSFKENVTTLQSRGGGVHYLAFRIVSKERQGHGLPLKNLTVQVGRNIPLRTKQCSLWIKQ